MKCGRGSKSGTKCWMTRWFPWKKGSVFVAGRMKPYEVGIGQWTVCLRVIFCEFLLVMLSRTVSSPHLMRVWKPVKIMALNNRSS